jgi:hypothetical protein
MISRRGGISRRGDKLGPRPSQRGLPDLNDLATVADGRRFVAAHEVSRSRATKRAP